ncbi:MULTISPECIES: YceI family protein [Chryseobacterium]|uniref:Polyisoprenoid-binding protein YceI n=1 Tax=Chryseobacterium camelliae TaxID=1265445 RepID=A0ABU0TM41_9FLAO|nr:MULTISPECIES: YceI family protein [Chryseobacterium]MDT3408849.1 polyisoprenoid-binding protein YceI [Pseudacidovorax intermedius]MDQ1097293.1 polyisoprenoid-binding protein YceI [Chryseobacterium camelliae]MDQ1101226.1 polyisoprenoid-binding protein YceI [Chryseobacterium sp. SORGH_AS_1048]MDR6084672.1 polyisoprenoid-binding protein YceI [Chryseobacterium sp. SORGH_AS_0909]MDR6132944.1 polyisoprenoid-binding protein YceI [Chryseobacterium sp. SORGH_AS_1175]
MRKKLLTWVIPVFFAATAVVSCKKEKPVTSESSEVTTTKNGSQYTLDTLNSRVEWKGYKIFKSESTSHFGTIRFESGDVTVKDGKLESGKFVADMNSLTSVDLKDDQEQMGKLNSHLKSGDFFEVDKFPTASYEITKVTSVSEGDYNTLLDGNLTIKGITRPVQFKANVSVKQGGEVSIATEPKDISREEFGVKFQAPVQNGVIKNEVTLQINVKALEKK